MHGAGIVTNIVVFDDVMPIHSKVIFCLINACENKNNIIKWLITLFLLKWAWAACGGCMDKPTLARISCCK